MDNLSGMQRLAECCKVFQKNGCKNDESFILMLTTELATFSHNELVLLSVKLIQK